MSDRVPPTVVEVKFLRVKREVVTGPEGDRKCRGSQYGIVNPKGERSFVLNPFPPFVGVLDRQCLHPFLVGIPLLFLELFLFVFFFAKKKYYFLKNMSLLKNDFIVTCSVLDNSLTY